MSKYYVYRMDHDTGFAPNTKYGICTLSGCKNKKAKEKRNIEELAEVGDWVIGIGGHKTRKPDKLIYLMEVEKNLLYFDFVKQYPGKSKYLSATTRGTNVLISRKFYYFGRNALELPDSLSHIIWNRHGYKYKSMKKEDLDKLKKFISRKGYARYGVFGKPNNATEGKVRQSCPKTKPYRAY